MASDILNITLPYDESGERKVLKCLLLDGKLVERVNLTPDDFHSEKHRAIYNAMLGVHNQGLPLDAATLSAEVKKTGAEKAVGGFSALSSLLDEQASSADFGGYIKSVKALRKMRDFTTGFCNVLGRSSPHTFYIDITNLLNTSTNQAERPEMDAEAFYGLAGEVVNIIAPHSEADPVALLANFLTAYGNVIGDSAHFLVEATKHPMRLFSVLVGDTSKGRKGTSWDYIENLFRSLDADWVTNIQTGLSSGEGLIWAVRDEIKRYQQVRDGGMLSHYEEVVIDHGIDDKRLLIVEGEFGSPLRIMERDGNILSPIIRSAWDKGTLQVLTKNSPAKATNAHIAIIGHITRDELLRYLTSTEAGNGFGNRFLWLYVKRSKSLPFGGSFYRENVFPIMNKLHAAVAFGKGTEEITWAEETKPMWEMVYAPLSEGKPGLTGALMARGEAYTTRLACIYALLDLSREIRREHLRAALAFWDYVEDSVRYIFGNAVTPAASKLESALRERPMSKTEINVLLGKNYSSEQVDAMLQEMGATKETVASNGGRPRELWSIR